MTNTIVDLAIPDWWIQAPINKFCEVQINSQRYALFKIKEYIDNISNLLYDTVNDVDLPLGKIHHVYCSGLHVAYLIQLSKVRIKITENHIVAVKASYSKKIFTDVKLIHQSIHLLVFAYQDKAMLINDRGRHFIDVTAL